MVLAWLSLRVTSSKGLTRTISAKNSGIAAIYYPRIDEPQNRGDNSRMTQPRIRPLAICVFSHNGCILAAEGVDPLKDNQVFYRPLGGGIEFGEYAEQT